MSKMKEVTSQLISKVCRRLIGIRVKVEEQVEVDVHLSSQNCVRTRTDSWQYHLRPYSTPFPDTPYSNPPCHLCCLLTSSSLQPRTKNITGIKLSILRPPPEHPKTYGMIGIDNVSFTFPTYRTLPFSNHIQYRRSS